MGRLGVILMTKAVRIKNLYVGGGHPITIQSMTNTLTEDTEKTYAQIRALEQIGCDLVRVSCPTEKSIKSLEKLVKLVEIPIIADVHFDYKLALKAIDAGAHKIRLNPSNTYIDGIKEVARVASERNIPIRVGVNAGSFKKETTPETLANLALDSTKILEDNGHTDIVLAVKSSDVKKTVDAYRILSKMTDYPLHIGLTESGTKNFGQVKSAIAIGSLLLDGIGDTLRVSLAGDPCNEVIVAKEILRASGVDRNFVEIIACPTCSRTGINVEEIALKLEERVKNIRKPLKIAVMGCVVNGIGESQGTDFGVCGGAENSAIFKDGKIIKYVKNEEILNELMSLVEKYDG